MRRVAWRIVPPVSGRIRKMSQDLTGQPGFLPRVLSLLTRLVIARPRVSLAWIALTCIACLAGTFWGLKFKTDRSDLIDHRADFHQRWLKFAEEFGGESDAIVVVESKNTEAICAALEAIGQKLESEPQRFSRVQWKFDPIILRSKGLQFLPPVVLENALTQLKGYAPILQAGRWDLLSLSKYGENLARHLAESLQRQDNRATHFDLQQASLLANSLAGFLQNPKAFQSPWPEVIPAAAGAEMGQMQVHYNLNDRKTMGFILAVPSKSDEDFSGGSPSLKRLREIVSESAADHPEVTLGLTGIPFLEADEMAKSQEDMTLASMISLVGVALILVLGFRSFRHPLISMIMLVVGICWSLGFTTVAIGHLNILSVSFATILVGLGIDFAVHFLERYLELRHQGLDLKQALIRTSETTGAGIATCALTTALAFFCAGVTSFLGIAELGIIAGGGVLLCALASILVLPPLVCLSDGNQVEARLPNAFKGTPLRFVTNRFPGTVVVITAIAFILLTAMGLARKDGQIVSLVKYDSNLLNLQARGVPSVELQHRIFEQSDSSLLYAVSLANTPEEVRQLRERFLKLPSVGRVEELASLMPKYPTGETQVYIVQMHELLSKIPELPPQTSPIYPEDVGQGLEKLHQTLKTIPVPQAQQAAASLDAFLNGFQQIPDATSQAQFLIGYQHAMQLALRTQFQMLAQVTDSSPVVESLPDPLRSRFISPSGKWMLRIFPKEQVWDEAPLTRFVHDIRSIDAEATGTPLQNFEAANQIRESYLHSAILACAMVLFVLFIDLLRVGPLLISLLSPLVVVAVAMNSPAAMQTLNTVGLAVLYIVLTFVVATIFDPLNIGKAVLAMLPPLGGGLMTFGILALLKTNLNPANMIVLPLLLGIGVDSGVYVVHDYRAQVPGTYRISSSIINAITLTSITTMVGFGSMIVSSHQGLASLGIVLTAGVGSCLFISLVPLPALLTLLDRRRMLFEKPRAMANVNPQHSTDINASLTV